MKIPVLTSAVAFGLALSSPAFAQNKPDFSGTWRMDHSRSESSMSGESPGPVTVVITQTAAELRIETTTRDGTKTDVYRFAPATSAADNPVAQWRGDTLVTDIVRDVRGQSVTIQQSRRLGADGNEMIVESVLNVQHGYSFSGAKTYGAGKDVFVRVPR
jgi:hypothetical protein